MSRLLRAVRGAVCVACFAVLVPAASGQVNHPPVEAFGTLPLISRPAISPDGKHIATIQVYEGRPIIRIFTLDPPGTPAVPISFDEGFIDDVQWANNDRLLAILNVNQNLGPGDDVRAWHRMISMNTKGQEIALMFSDRTKSRNMNYSSATIADLAPDDPQYIYMPLYNDVSGMERASDSRYDYYFSLFRVEVATGNSKLVSRGSVNTEQWIMDGHGGVVARIDESVDPRTDHLKLYGKDGEWKEVLSAPSGEGNAGLQVIGLNEDGTALVLYKTSQDTRFIGLVAFGLADNAERPLYYNTRYDVDSTLTDPWTGRVIGVRVVEDRSQDIYFDPQLEAMQKGLEAVFADMSVHAVSWDISRQKVILFVESPHVPPVYFFLDRTTGKAQPIRKAYPGLAAADLGDVKPYPYKARDGLDIPAYLTLPPGKTPKGLPVVILPHGGPMVRDEIGFDFEAQFLANRGYAVLQPNFRGSSGYGQAFEEAGYGQWGLKMQDDITDGVRKLIAEGIADPKRICIVGGSYGGYAALAGAAFTPELYACAAAWAPVTDLRQFLATRAKDYGKDSSMIESWTHFIGDRWNDSTKLDAASPAENAARIRCPVLLMHGADDTTVRVDQSQIMERALRRAGKPVTYVEIPKETHYMETSATRIRWLSELEKFLAANIGT